MYPLPVFRFKPTYLVHFTLNVAPNSLTSKGKISTNLLGIVFPSYALVSHKGINSEAYHWTPLNIFYNNIMLYFSKMTLKNIRSYQH